MTQEGHTIKIAEREPHDADECANTRIGPLGILKLCGVSRRAHEEVVGEEHPFFTLYDLLPHIKHHRWCPNYFGRVGNEHCRCKLAVFRLEAHDE